jgi:hypothetical protein
VSASASTGSAVCAAMWRTWSTTSRRPMMPSSGTPSKNADICDPEAKKHSNPICSHMRA